MHETTQHNAMNEAVWNVRNTFLAVHDERMDSQKSFN